MWLVGIYFMENQVEIWKDVIGYEGIYMVSNLGNVKSMRKSNCLHERILVQGTNYGYKYVFLCVKNKVKGKRVHVLVAETFISLKPSYIHQVNHINGIKSDNNVSNLEWCTPSENKIHNARILKQNTCEKHNKAKLNWIKVDEIRKIYSTIKISHAKLANEYSISKSVITSILNNKTWVNR